MTYPKVDFLPDETTADGAADHAASAGVVASPKFPEIEERILKYWDEDGTFLASVEGRDAGENGANEFVFYDGPPFANGLPHYGHLLTGYVKDLIPRYQTMRGKRVERRFGWDCASSAIFSRSIVFPMPCCPTTRMQSPVGSANASSHAFISAWRPTNGPIWQILHFLRTTDVRSVAIF